MSAYTINIENKDKPLERNIFIENENGMSICSWYGEDSIELSCGLYEGIANLDKQGFLELYEIMTVLKKYIDEK